jgi:tRNA-Thr(GGU) m(6)t(6)A37 methyltransferase TsaA
VTDAPRLDDTFVVLVIGLVRSPLTRLSDAPRQGDEGAPDAWLDLDPTWKDGLSGLEVGADVIVITWLHHADRAILEVHPRDDPGGPLTGVFATRSPDRPNPLGLHRVTVKQVAECAVLVGPLEAIDGTPVVDIKIALGDVDR